MLLARETYTKCSASQQYRVVSRDAVEGKVLWGQKVKFSDNSPYIQPLKNDPLSTKKFGKSEITKIF